jgi:hypothetical protein
MNGSTQREAADCVHHTNKPSFQTKFTLVFYHLEKDFLGRTEPICSYVLVNANSMKIEKTSKSCSMQVPSDPFLSTNNNMFRYVSNGDRQGEGPYITDAYTENIE